MATRHWIQDENGDDVAGPFDHEGAANQAKDALNRETENGGYTVKTLGGPRDPDDEPVAPLTRSFRRSVVR